MSDRIYALTVLLEAPVRDDDVAALIAAIGQLRGVLQVQPHVADVGLHWAEERARRTLEERLWKALKEPIIT